jgi:hypothetical protein
VTRMRNIDGVVGIKYHREPLFIELHPYVLKSKVSMYHHHNPTFSSVAELFQAFLHDSNSSNSNQ